MMNSFLEIELTQSTMGNGGAFYCNASFDLDNFNAHFQNITVKIDTGCSVSTIPMKKLNVSDQICQSLKSTDIDNSVEYMRSYGVETGGLYHPEPITKEQKMKCTALKFKHAIKDLRLNGMLIPTQTIFLNYDRSGNILIGMDILSMMKSYCDISKKTGKLTLLCCLRNAMTIDFDKALMDHFGLKYTI